MSTAINNTELVLTDAKAATRVAFVVSGSFESPMGFRARAFAGRLSEFDVRIVYRSSRKILSIITLFLFLARNQPAVVYVFDISYSAVLSACFYRLVFRGRLVVETGDAIVELARSTGSRGRIGLLLTQFLENGAFQFADQIVVRGSFHREWLRRKGIEAEVIQDGVDVKEFSHGNAEPLRKQNNLDGFITIGLVGSSIWSERLQMCYGWELVETIRLLKDKPVKGIIIGDGSGIAHLKSRCREYGIEDRVLFLGRLPFEELNQHLQLIDICLSTQTNDLVGKARTTGKLPLYLAAGRYVLASNVGEAKLVLPERQLVDYDGVKDLSYPMKLKERVEGILLQPEVIETSHGNTMLARDHFDYGILAERVKRLIDRLVR